MGVQTVLQLALAVGASASVLPRAPSAGFVSFPIHHQRRDVLTKREDDVTLYNHSTIAYMVELQIGTPPQTVRVQLDTGSDELWVDPDCSAISNSASAQFCSSLRQYDPNASSTVVDQGVSKQLSYGIGQADIEYVTDVITIPGTKPQTLKDVVFGVATQSQDAAVPIMGVGFGMGKNLKYNNIIDELQAQGATNSKAFSLALGSANQNNGGVIIFGGIDTKKFSGKLHTYTNLPPQKGEQGLWRYWIQLDSVGMTKPGSSSSSPYAGSSMPIVLDSGSSYSYLPTAVVNRLATDFGSTVDSTGSIAVSCSLMNQGGTVDFTFADLTIRVPYKEFIRQLDASNCEVGVQPTGDDGTSILGDTFLRSAYVVFDQTNEQIFMAPYSNCGNSEQELQAGQGAIANMTGQCNAPNPNAASGPTRNMFLAAACFIGLQAVMAFL